VNIIFQRKYLKLKHDFEDLRIEDEERVQNGRAVAQEVSVRLPTAVARFRVLVRTCGICGGQSGTGAGFLLVQWFPLPSIPLTAPHAASSIIRGWYNRALSGLGSAPP
jgi:hypothetical protein